VAVIGFDDLPTAQQTDPRLTTVRQPVDAMGTRMVTEILAQIADPGREPSRVVLDTQLILRGSALRSLARDGTSDWPDPTGTRRQPKTR
jgi:DNA-binding LacI/PurR family transcriptional regulator